MAGGVHTMPQATAQPRSRAARPGAQQQPSRPVLACMQALSESRKRSISQRCGAAPHLSLS